MCLRGREGIYICVCVCLSACMCVCVFVYACVCVRMRMLSCYICPSFSAHPYKCILPFFVRTQFVLSFPSTLKTQCPVIHFRLACTTIQYVDQHDDVERSTLIDGNFVRPNFCPTKLLSDRAFAQPNFCSI